MTFPLQITFRHMPPSRIFENRIRELARRFEKFSSRIASCHVVVEQPHQSAAQGGLFNVHITIQVPGSTIVVSRSHAADPKHANAYVSLRDAFNVAKRKLLESERIVRGEVKTRLTQEIQEVPAA
jgi:ribosome-associated translation inhibitor RaiA